MRDELLNRKVFETLLKGQALTARRKLEYNTKRPHNALGDRPLAPEAAVAEHGVFGSAMLRLAQQAALGSLSQEVHRTPGAVHARYSASRRDDVRWRETTVERSGFLPRA